VGKPVVVLVMSLDTLPALIFPGPAEPSHGHPVGAFQLVFFSLRTLGALVAAHEVRWRPLSVAVDDDRVVAIPEFVESVQPVPTFLYGRSIAIVVLGLVPHPA